MTGTDARNAYLLSIADDELVIGHRQSHWTGFAPSLEEDLAFATISQDEINHADVWYQVLVGGERAGVDALGLGRQPEEYRHAVLCERPPGDFAYTIARQFLYDHFDAVRLEALRDSADDEVAAVARKLAHEERYHLQHADEWMARIAGGGEEPRRRLGEALGRAWPEALGLFEPTPGEQEVVAGGVLTVGSAELLGRWVDVVEPLLAGLGYREVVSGVERDRDGVWALPGGFFAEPAGRHGVHTADWIEDVWPEMTMLYRRYPGARW
jgi:ring-1,2-phenylacetyl-CoA epoxidase subunit PaaC